VNFYSGCIKFLLLRGMTKRKMSGSRLREIRTKVRMKQAQIGQVIGVHWTTISDWERLPEVPHYAAMLAELLADPATRDKVEKLAGLQ
jgi:DNA-binding transcriptional regulator YiaG